MKKPISIRTKALIYLVLMIQLVSVQAQEFNWATPVSGDGYEYGIKIAKDALGNTFILGYTTEHFFEYEGVTYASNGDGDAFFAKLDPNKQLVWMRPLGANDAIYYDEAQDLHIDPFGDIYLSIRATGSSFRYNGMVLSGINSIGQYGGEAVLIKVNGDGDYLWHDSGTVGSSFRGITTDVDGNVYITGYFRQTITLGDSITLTNPSSGTTTDYLLAKYQPDGTIMWAKRAGGLPHNTFAYGHDLEINPQTNELIVLALGEGEVFFDGVPMPSNGLTDNAALLISYELDGIQNWMQLVLVEDNYGYSSCTSLAISDSGIMGVCGTTVGMDPEGLVGFYNSDGSVISEHTYPAPYDLRLYSITFNEYDIAYVSGWCLDGGTLGIAPGTVTLNNTTGFIVRMDKHQQVRWVTEFAGSHFTNYIDYSNGELLYAGRFDEEFIYNSEQNVLVNNLGDAVYAQMIDDFLGVAEYIADEIAVYPNPTSGLLMIKSTALQKIEIYNVNGVCVKTTDKNEIDLSSNSPGIYLLKIITDKGVATKKIVLK